MHPYILDLGRAEEAAYSWLRGPCKAHRQIRWSRNTGVCVMFAMAFDCKQELTCMIGSFLSN
eukprot:c30466_g1_i1 orf=213-398(+)